MVVLLLVVLLLVKELSSRSAAPGACHSAHGRAQRGETPLAKLDPPTVEH